jgi:crotonobetainyl-CoA:carnitine CoA-transferase CaiB-like acyl-CoA transferase
MSAQASGGRNGPLRDVRILDCTQALAGPFCTMLLADLGADVIKVEPPRGDMARVLGPRPKDTKGCDYGGYFASINRNKRSIVLDLKEEGDRDVFLTLVESADAVVENARVGVMDRLGLSYEALRARNERLVYVAIRGFGDPRTGASPYAAWPAFDIVAQSMGGMVGLTGPRGTAGMPAGASVGDLFPGTLAALGLVSALLAARSSGRGQFVDVAMYDAVLSLCENIVYKYAADGTIERPKGQGHPVLCPFDVYETSDGAVAIAAPADPQWRMLCDAMEREDLAEDDRSKDVFARHANRDFVNETILAWTRAHTRGEVVDALAGRVPVGPVQNAEDIFRDPHAHIREMLVEVEQPGSNPPLTLAGAPIKLTETPSGVYRRPPLVGEHTIEVLAEAGITREEKS